MFCRESFETPFAVRRVLDAIECLADEGRARHTVVNGLGELFQDKGLHRFRVVAGKPQVCSDSPVLMVGVPEILDQQVLVPLLGQPAPVLEDDFAQSLRVRGRIDHHAAGGLVSGGGEISIHDLPQGDEADIAHGNGVVRRLIPAVARRLAVDSFWRNLRAIVEIVLVGKVHPHHSSHGLHLDGPGVANVLQQRRQGIGALRDDLAQRLGTCRS